MLGWRKDESTELLNRTGMWLETALAGSLTPAVRRVMHIELSMSLAYGVFYATTIPFTQVVLRRLGATVDMLALYTALLFVVRFTSFSIVLMRRRRTINLIFFCWLLGRSLFLLAAFVTGAVPLMAISILFSLLESFVIPAYTRRHPEDLSGKRAGQSDVHCADGAGFGHPMITPLAGWAIGPGGYRVLFPVGALFGILATFLFTRINLDEGELPPRKDQDVLRSVADRAHRQNFAIYLLSYSLFGLGGLLSWPLYPVVQVDRLQLSYADIGLLGLVESVTWLFSYLLWGRTIDKRGGLYVVAPSPRPSHLDGTPITYMFAQNLWMLLPSAIAGDWGWQASN